MNSLIAISIATYTGNFYQFYHKSNTLIYQNAQPKEKPHKLSINLWIYNKQK